MASARFAELADLDMVLHALPLREEESLMNNAIIEGQHALLLGLEGHYRAAFHGLRLFIESVVAGVYFSAHVLALKQWEQHYDNINWHKMAVADETSIFGKPFVSLFEPRLIDALREHGENMRMLYHNCSQYVHATAGAASGIGNRIDYQPPLLTEWLSMAQTAYRGSLVMLAMRYVNACSAEQKARIEPIYMRDVAFVEALRTIFS
ncbi:MAG TPA: hypothetical protein VII30_08195 [Gemmatimonadaceae bacterium]